METNERLLLRPEEVGQQLGVSRSKAYELIATGEVPSIKIGRCVRVPLDALKTRIDELLQKPRGTSPRP